MTSASIYLISEESRLSNSHSAVLPSILTNTRPACLWNGIRRRTVLAFLRSLQASASFLVLSGSRRLSSGSGAEWMGTSSDTVTALVTYRERLPNLKALFLGDIAYEENEISWINQSDLSPLWPSFPHVEHIKVRGGNNLTLGRTAFAGSENAHRRSGWSSARRGAGRARR